MTDSTLTAALTLLLKKMEPAERNVYMRYLVKGWKPDPVTPALNLAERWWHGKLDYDGLIKRKGGWPVEIRAAEMADDFLAAPYVSGMTRRSAEMQISKMMKNLCPPHKKRRRRRSNGEMATWYILPSQKVAREWFSSVYPPPKTPPGR